MAARGNPAAYGSSSGLLTGSARTDGGRFPADSRRRVDETDSSRGHGGDPVRLLGGRRAAPTAGPAGVPRAGRVCERQLRHQCHLLHLFARTGSPTAGHSDATDGAGGLLGPGGDLPAGVCRGELPAMTLAEQLAVIDRWANCRCVLTRAPMDPCRCWCWPRDWGWEWRCDNPVKESEELTARDKAERRKRKRGGGGRARGHG